MRITERPAHVAELKVAVLRGHGLNAVMINKQDSSYLFGAAEIYVPQDEVIRAKRILKEDDA